jgi:hypothetical protein
VIIDWRKPMKRSWIVLAIALAITAPLSAAAPRILDGRVPAADLETVRIDAGVGDIDITVVDGTDEVAVTVELKARRGGFFSSLKKAQAEVDEAELRLDVSRGVLRLKISTEIDDRHFEERWTVELPARLGCDLDLGVGDIDVRGLSGDLTVDLGVGDVEAVTVSGDLNIDIGVGEASVEAAAADYGRVDGSGGVGNARLTVRGEQISSSGFVGKSAEWTGPGDRVIEISVGVGDAKVTLE